MQLGYSIAYIEKENRLSLILIVIYAYQIYNMPVNVHMLLFVYLIANGKVLYQSNRKTNNVKLTS